MKIKFKLTDEDIMLRKAQRIAVRAGLSDILDDFCISGDMPTLKTQQEQDPIKKVWFTATEGSYTTSLGYISSSKNWSFSPSISSSRQGLGSHLDNLHLEADMVKKYFSKNPKMFNTAKYIIVQHGHLRYSNDMTLENAVKVEIRKHMLSSDGIKKLVQLIDEGESLKTIFRVFRYGISRLEDIELVRDAPEEWISTLFTDVTIAK